MAIINVTQKNFSKLVSEKIDELEKTELLFTSLLGGKDNIKKALADVPDENLLWVNTDHVVAVSGPVRMAGTDDVVFRIYFQHPGNKEDAVWVKVDDYKRFVMAWAGEVKSINEGEYEVPSGYRVVVSEDGGKVKVEKAEDQKKEN